MDISRLYHTLRYLRPAQWFYRGWYKVKQKLYTVPSQLIIPVNQAMVFGQKAFYPYKVRKSYELSDNTFHFLNISHSFGKYIDWDLEQHGRLWTYNLNYFAWLNDNSLSVQARLLTLYSYVLKKDHKTGSESYPISLRGINWIRFLCSNDIHDEATLEQLYRDYDRLAAFPEYHIQANHLLENGCSLLYAAHFFNDTGFFELANDILTRELKEQVLPDGGHYELSPMYHSIILQRLLECYEIVFLSDRFKNTDLESLIKDTASKMLGWLNAFSFRNGTYAMMGDAAPDIALGPEELYAFALHLGIRPTQAKLRESGYRKMYGANYELLLDAGNIMPSYQPGHAHADTFSFCLEVDGQPVIVDTGISTYDKNNRRLEERGTEAHNTLCVEGMNSSDVWDGFRAGRRASVTIHEDTDHTLTASHNGYKSAGIVHERKVLCKERQIIIEDKVKGYKGQQIYSRIHFHPSCKVEQTGPMSFKTDKIIINISGGTGAGLVNYLYCSGFNQTEPAIGIRIHVEEHAVVSIDL